MRQETNTRVALRDGSPGLTVGQGSDAGRGAEGDAGAGGAAAAAPGGKR